MIPAIPRLFPELESGGAEPSRPNAETGSEDLIIVAELRASNTDVDQQTLRRNIKATVAQALGVTVNGVTFIPAGWIVKTTSGKIDRENNYKPFSMSAS